MAQTTRREMVKGSLAGMCLAGLHTSGSSQSLRAAGPNGEVRVAIIGLGGIDVVGGVGGRGRQLIQGLRDVPGVKIAALCDVDESILNNGAEQFKERRENVKTHTDLRRVFDDQEIDAVLVATPNHWHALATVWACQAEKDVYVEKPFSHDIWEGRQMVAAARNHDRIVQVGTQRRSSSTLPQVFQYVHSGEIGALRGVYAIVYRARKGIGAVDSPTPIPDTVNYDLWCGPVPQSPLMRKQLHYEWHWFWSTGNGEIGNNGIHTIDVARWALNQDGPPPRAMSIGGRFGPKDAAETPNTQIAIMDYQPAPLICEVRNLQAPNDRASIGKFRGSSRGLVIDCEGGYCTETSSGFAVFDRSGSKIKDFPSVNAGRETLSRHLANFLDAVRSRSRAELHCEAKEGHNSAMCFHMANISHRLGSSQSPQEILERTKANSEFSDAFERCREHLQANGIDLATSHASAGPWVTYDSKLDRFVGDFADQANQLSRKQYRKPFVVPQLVG